MPGGEAGESLWWAQEMTPSGAGRSSLPAQPPAPLRALNACLKAALLPELWWLRRADLLWGVSLAAIARKKA